jgi:hypothetical protein
MVSPLKSPFLGAWEGGQPKVKTTKARAPWRPWPKNMDDWKVEK